MSTLISSTNVQRRMACGSLEIESARFVVDEFHQVQDGEVAGGIVQEHVFGAGVGGVDAARFRAGVPFVDGGVVLHAGIGTFPGGFGDLVPEVAGPNRLVDPAVGAASADSSPRRS